MTHHFKTGDPIPAPTIPVVKVVDLMARRVVTTMPHQTVGHVKKILRKHRFLALPIVDPEGLPVGIVTSSDLLADLSESRPIGDIMTRKVYAVPQYEDPATAARIMRNHKIHHVVITHEKKVVGILSSFDLLKLIDGKQYTARRAPTRSKSGKGGRKRVEEIS